MPSTKMNFIEAGKHCASRGMHIPSIGQLDAIQAASDSIPDWSFKQYYVFSSQTNFALVSCGVQGNTQYCGDNRWTAFGYPLCVKTI